LRRMRGMEALNQFENMATPDQSSEDFGSIDHPLGLPRSVLLDLPSDMGTGEADQQSSDPKYGLRFARLSDEVQKLGSTDFDLISRLSVELLEVEGKDLRVLGFLCLSELHERGISGFAVALEAVAGIIEEHSEALFPRREQGRRSAIEWLNNQRIVAFVKRYSADCAITDLERALNQLDRLDVALGLLFAEPPALRNLREFMQVNLRERQATNQHQQSVAEGSADYLVSSDSARSGAPNKGSSPDRDKNGLAGVAAESKVTSERDLSKHLRSVLDYLRSENDLMRMVALSRCWKWAGLLFVTVKYGRIGVEPPRGQAIRSIKNKLQQGNNWHEVIAACESAFLEPGGHLCLDIQVWEERAAMELGMDYLAKRIRSETKELIERIPELPGLSFVDGSPLLSAENRDWINALVNGDDEDGNKICNPNVAVPRKSFKEYISEAKNALSLRDFEGEITSNSYNRGLEGRAHGGHGSTYCLSKDQAKVSVEFIIDL
ncbi:TssA family type VI secretion system protein, partial [Halorhodospira halochloris]|uniref:TssA family type VI secretion system protein n=1 Tax=Halorhodospira halochloris TaxID=1052 RepID=UPI001EE7D9EA